MSPTIFRGRYEPVIDPKGRLAIPARFREALEASHGGQVVVTNLAKCLVAYTPEEWEGIEAKAGRLPGLKPAAAAFLRFFYSGAVFCDLDAQGRILIPPSLRSHAALEKQVVVAGLLNKFEIWSRQRWDEEQAEVIKNFDQIAADLADFGF